MIGCLRTRVRKQPIIALYFESETVLKGLVIATYVVYLIFDIVCMFQVVFFLCLVVPCVGLQRVIVIFPDHTHLLFVLNFYMVCVCVHVRGSSNKF